MAVVPEAGQHPLRRRSPRRTPRAAPVRRVVHAAPPPEIMGRMSRATLAKEPREVAGMFDAVARRYDLTNDVMSLWQVRVWRAVTRSAVAARPGTRVLDLAAGTGTSAAEYAADGADVVACDFSTGMIAEGRRRHPGIAFVAGDATALPFADGTFDAVTISYGLRNVQDTVGALKEMARWTATMPPDRFL